MTMLQALFLGMLQGITEFIPVSSSGHLILARTFMGLEEIPALFDVVLHMATLVVVLGVFRKEVAGLLTALWRGIRKKLKEEDRPSLRLAGFLAGASAVTAFLGLGLSLWEGRENPRLTAVFFLFTAFVLILSAFPKRQGSPLSWGKALLIGVSQGLGVFPGISRSGITIGTGLLLGLDRKSAGTFSFLLSLPAVTGAFLLTLKDAEKLGESVSGFPLALGFLAALVSGYGALKLLLWLVKSGKLWVFSFYLVPAGITGLLLL